ncbi:hypothetical protein HRQ91_05715 [Treponema parvum]|uniref:DUF4139 domain-containing protein n=1 Tax=Treponema parvum TaxID=138851 RepID=A0A975F6F0_9SPIR|nr:hypothetical protein HRQ91_05715 [Treponema parvum]
MKRTLLVIISVCIFFAQAVFSQDSTPAATNLSHAGISIRFYDRTMYYPNEAKTNPIYVHITIANRGPETLRFKLADNRLFSLSFRAFDVKNNQLPLSESLIVARTTSQTVFYRDIALEAGEEYSFVENVKDYLQIKEPAIYYLEMEFFPELYKPVSAAKLLSNRLTMEIRPSPSASASIVLPIQDKTTSILKPESISPDQVVEQTITACQKALWDQFFLYMDLEELLKNSSRAAKTKYQSVSANERARMIENYKADLMQSRIDTNIVAVPSEFQIENTIYSPVEGSVSVIEWFQNTGFKEKKRYTYHLRRRDGIWQIYKYNVDNLGRE